jgi:biotin transport system permease protein
VSSLALHRPGASPLHRLPAGAKLAALGIGLVALLQVRSPAGTFAAATAVAGLYAIAGMTWRVLLEQLRPLRWFALVLATWQAVVAGWAAAVVVVGGIALAVALAALVTLTTPFSALLDIVERSLWPLRRLRVDPDRVALLLALAVRSLPVLHGIAGEVRDAARARGGAASPLAYAVPFVVRTLRHADALGEALAARGVDD